MKHNKKITIILLAMFILTQLIGIYVVNFYSDIRVINGVAQKVAAPRLPYGMQPPEIQRESDFYRLFPFIIIAFIIAISLVFLLSRFNIEFVLKLWFFAVVIIALGISLNSIFPQFKYMVWIVLVISVALAFEKIYRRNFIIHNFTELWIYPGIAAVFVPIFNLWTIIILLILISAYDIWAVWHSGIMQQMAKYQINKLKIFSGFFVPYLSKKEKIKLKMLKLKKKKPKKGIRVNVGILGGGDIIFPIITAGVMLRRFGIISSFFIIFGATVGLTYLFLSSEKKKFYPAMPFITAGIFAGMVLYVFVYYFFKFF